MHKAHACQRDLQDVVHRTNTCTTICMATQLRRLLHMASHDQRADDDLHGTWDINTWDTYCQCLNMANG